MLAEIIAGIRAAHRDRCFYMKLRIRVLNQLGAFLRLQYGWSPTLPEKQSERIKRSVAKLIANPEGEWKTMIEEVKRSILPFEASEDDRVRTMERLAKQLPVWKAFGEQIRGFGLSNFATIIAEAGDLSDYATDAKLWKRMGVAVLNGVRQGGLSKGASADDWIAHGYNKKRRSWLWNVGGPLVKLNDGVYRAAYERRRLHTQQTHPEWWVDAKGKPKFNKDGNPASLHGMLDAQRYMEKKLLRDIWRAWRRAGMSESCGT